MSREGGWSNVGEVCTQASLYHEKNTYDRRSERGQERIPECERRQYDEFEIVKFSPKAIFNNMVMKKGNINFTMGLIH